MSKKHFEQFAREIRILQIRARNAKKDGHLAEHDEFIQQAIGATEVVARVAKTVNPLFNEARFRTACAYNGEEVAA